MRKRNKNKFERLSIQHFPKGGYNSKYYKHVRERGKLNIVIGKGRIYVCGIPLAPSNWIEEYYTHPKTYEKVEGQIIDGGNITFKIQELDEEFTQELRNIVKQEGGHYDTNQ